MTTSRPSVGLTANCTFDPPVSTPISRSTAIEALRIIWYSLSVRVSAGATRDRIAGVDAHRIDVLDRADDDAVVGAVAHDLHLVFLPAEHRFLDQHLVRRRGAQAAADDLLELLAVVGDAAAGAAQGEGRPDDRRQADRRRAPRSASSSEPTSRLFGESRPIRSIAWRNSWRSSALSIAVVVGADQLDAVALAARPSAAAPSRC